MQVDTFHLEMFTPFIFADENGKVKGVSHDGVGTEFEIRFENILAFATGSPSEPPIGFHPSPALSFQNSSPYPRANTCANVIYLPFKDLPEPQMPFERFVYYMTSGILNTAGFGQV